MTRTEGVLLSAVFALVVSAAVAGLTGMRLNLSPSVGGIVFRADSKVAIAVGDYVSFCLPMRLGEVPAMASAALPVCMQDQSGLRLLKKVVRINDSGDYFVIGEHPQSLDSRVFGWISREVIKDRLVRVW